MDAVYVGTLYGLRSVDMVFGLFKAWRREPTLESMAGKRSGAQRRV
jgi:hypothetical protein